MNKQVHLAKGDHVPFEFLLNPAYAFNQLRRGEIQSSVAGNAILSSDAANHVLKESSSDVMNDKARSMVGSASRIAVLTGAGMSAPSGIPTFRQAPDSLWSNFSPEELASQDGWRRDPALVWGWYLWRMAQVREAIPNAGHVALADAAARRELRIITQNVDDLHERAGSHDVIHLHGGLFAHRCFACARPHSSVEIPPAAETPLRIMPPRCRHCGGRIRPGVVWFGERLLPATMKAAQAEAKACDLMLVVGTSGSVYPAATLPALAQQHGAKIVEINPLETELPIVADLTIRGNAATVLPALLG